MFYLSLPSGRSRGRNPYFAAQPREPGFFSSIKIFFFLSEFSSLHFFIRVKLSLPQKALSDMAAQLFPFMYQHYVLDIMVIVKHNLLSRTFIFLLHLAKSY